MNTRPVLGAQPYFGEDLREILRDIEGVLRNGQLTHGAFLPIFEEQFAKVSGTKFALGVSSGGTALELILKALGVEGKEVIVPTDTFVATANAVFLAGGTPVFADISPQTLALTPATVAPLINDKTAAVILVHMFGLIPHDIFDLRTLCEEKGIHLIEDAAHAHGASIMGERAGSIGIAGAFSFYPTKIMTTGEGGIISTNDEGLAKMISILRNHGKSLVEPVFEEVSNNYRLAEIPAILGFHQVGLLDENLSTRRKIAAFYREELSAIDGLTLLPREGDKESNVFWRFPAFLSPRHDRHAFQKYCDDEHGVRITWMYEPLCHEQPVFQKNCKDWLRPLPAAEECMKRLICLPCYPGLSQEDLYRVTVAVKEGCKKSSI